MEAIDTELYQQNPSNSSTLIVDFFTEAVLDDRATSGWVEETFDIEAGQHKTVRHPGAGRPIYREAEWIEIRIPGNVSEVRRREVRPSDKVRFPQQYAAFKSGQAAPEIGTPLDRLPFLSKSQVKEFQAAGLRTAENVRDISDGDRAKFMGLQNLRKRIIDFLDAAAGNAPMVNLRSELEGRDSQIAALQRQVAELVKRVDGQDK